MKIAMISAIIMLFIASCAPYPKEWCVSCGNRFHYSELRVNEYGIQFCVPCAKDYPNLFKNILIMEDEK